MRITTFLLVLTSLLGQAPTYRGSGAAHAAAASGFTAITVLRHRCDSGSSSAATTMAVDMTGATGIVLAITSFQGVASPTPSDSSMNTWTASATAENAANEKISMWYVANPSTSAMQTFSVSGVTTFPVVCVVGFSHSKLTAPLDQTSTNTTGADTTLDTGSVTPSEDNEILLVGLAYGPTTGTTVSIDSGFNTPPDNVDYSPGNNFGGAISFLVQSTAGALNPTWTWTAAEKASTAIITLKHD